MNLNLNPKVLYAALAAGAVGGLATLTIALQNTTYSTPKAVFVALGAAFLTGFVGGLSGWLKDQENWTPAATPPPAITPPPPTK